ncbi:MAG TPA: YdeI/OmpD-associated family protein [Aggregatilineales bacterium]|nr:YdeI/OmpD-associated family protein [Aggregatilineales bacterium]
MPAELPIVHFASAQDWEQWLEHNHTDSPGLWLKIAKAGSGHASVSYQEALDLALCFGWIDGQKGAFDDEFWLQKFTQRRPKSIWSQVNREKIAALTAAGKMREAGLRQVEAAKADGRWDAAYASQKNMTVPEDFQAALDSNPAALAFWGKLNGTNRYAVLHQIVTAKKAETRQKRIEKFIQMLTENKKLY